MANTIMTAKNTFAEGLVMDFAPDNTSADTLTSALNATLTTFNGNEMALLNDMGNARVETAYLPEGYIPVGTCEYGDIIYIVSYNPLLNKSQIGCFPSPERNISSDEVVNGGDKLQISESQFLKPVRDNFGMLEVATTSAKFILTKKNLNPGDKYVIYTDNIFDEPYISDIGNTDHDYGKFPKYLKIHVISIDNSNKIDYLDSDVIWYDKTTELTRKDYFINEINKDSTDKPDIDSYRNALSSGYSVFQSKVSGKLALLVELEAIDSFSCTYNIYKHIDKNLLKEPIEYLNYDIYFNINWGTNNYNINPSLICLYNQSWSGTNSDLAGKVLYWKTDTEGKDYYILKDPKALDVDQLTGPDLIGPNNTKIKAVQDSDSTWENVYKANISRSYLPENLISYKDFKTKASYDKILDITLKYIKYTLYIEDNPVIDTDLYILKCELKKPNKESAPLNDWLNKDTSEISLSSVVANRNKSIPVEGEYYINANAIFLDKTESKYYTSFKDNEIRIYPYKITDDIINNYFNYSISKKFAEIKIPTKLKFDNIELIPDISNLIYNYEVAPVMPYGILPHLISKGTINFSKIGSGEITMSLWKYYNTENTSTLTVGFNIFPEENMGVAGINIDFMDNLGIAATYSLEGNSSYSGTFTDLIPLNNSFSNYKLKTKGIHAGIEDANGTVYFPKIEGDTILNASGIKENGEATTSKSVTIIKSIPGNSEETCAVVDSEGTKWYKWDNKQTTKHINDFGTLYSNFLYLAVITIKYCYKNALGEYDSSDTSNFEIFYRWFWTNEMYNDNYYSIEDFDNLPFELLLDLAASYNTQNYNSTITKKDLNKNDLENPSNNFGTILENIKTTINSDINLGLLDTYNTFSLNPSIQVDVQAYIGNNGIDAETSKITSTNGINAVDSPVLYSERVPIGENKPNIDDLPETDPYLSLYNWQKLSNENLGESENSFEYIDYKGEIVSLNNPKSIKLKREGNKFNTLYDYELLAFSNYYNYVITEISSAPILRPLVYDKESAAKYGILCNDISEEEQNLPYLGEILSIGTFRDLENASQFGDEGYVMTRQSYDVKTRDLINARIHDAESWRRNWPFGHIPIGSTSTGFKFIRFFSWMPSNFNGQSYPDKHNYGTGVILGSGQDDLQRNGLDNYKILAIQNIGYSINGNDASGTFWLRYYDKDNNLWNYNSSVPNIFSSDTRPPIFLGFSTNGRSTIILNAITQGDVKSNITDLYMEKNYAIERLNKEANKLLVILTNLYIKEEATKQPISVIKDIVYLEPRILTFNYDILYKTKVSAESGLESINIQGIQFSKYIESLQLTKLDLKKIKYSNISLELLNIIKNIPISFLIISKKPENLYNEYNVILLEISEKAHIYTPYNISELIDNLLYTITSEHKVIPYISNTSYYRDMSEFYFNNINDNLYFSRLTPIRKYQQSLLLDGWEYDIKNLILQPYTNSNKAGLLAVNSWKTSASGYGHGPVETDVFNIFKNIGFLSYDNFYYK